MRRRRETIEIVFASAQPAATEISHEHRPRLSGTGELRRLSGDPERGICGMHYCAWNGGWAFYCACGFCAPRSRSFSDGLETLERHWQRRWDV